jgi:hypothetical protein
MPVPSQGHYGFHSFPEFGNFDITLISYFKLNGTDVCDQRNHKAKINSERKGNGVLNHDGYI